MQVNCAQNFFSHAPKTFTTPLINAFLALTKIAVLGQVVMKNKYA